MAVAFALVWIAVGVGIGAVARVVVNRVRPPRPPRDLTDSLTGLADRGTGQRALNSLRVDDAVAMIDLDGLKATNDTRGHAAGDAELIALARHLSNGVRTGDVVARWGGDEFVVVLRGGGPAAASVIDRLRASAPTAFSAGIALHRGGDGNDTLADADTALLQAKRAGGSRVITR